MKLNVPTNVKVRSLVADAERAVPDIVWGGAEGEAQVRHNKHDKIEEAEKLQTGVVIR